VQVNLVGTEFGSDGKTSYPLPLFINLTNSGYTCSNSSRTSVSSMRVCCAENTTANATLQVEEYQPLETGDITISYDVIKAYEANYWAQVRFADKALFSLSPHSSSRSLCVCLSVHFFFSSSWVIKELRLQALSLSLHIFKLSPPAHLLLLLLHEWFLNNLWWFLSLFPASQFDAQHFLTLWLIEFLDVFLEQDEIVLSFYMHKCPPACFFCTNFSGYNFKQWPHWTPGLLEFDLGLARRGIHQHASRSSSIIHWHRSMCVWTSGTAILEWSAWLEFSCKLWQKPSHCRSSSCLL
jgi:hypothetical protein